MEGRVGRLAHTSGKVTVPNNEGAMDTGHDAILLRYLSSRDDHVPPVPSGPVRFTEAVFELH